MKKNKKISFAFALLSFALTIFYIYINCKASLDSDMASEMVLANLLNKEHSIMSTNWYYSTEVRVIHMQLLFKLGLYVFPNNWALARLFAQSIALVLLALSIIYFSYSIGFNEKGIYLAAILIQPISFWWFFHSVFSGFYIVHSIPPLICLGILFRSIKSDRFIPCCVAMALTSLMFGINGIKELMYVSFPLLATSFIYLAIILHKDGFKKELKEYKFFIISLVNCVFSFAGYLIYEVVLSKNYTFAEMMNQTWDTLNISTLINGVGKYLQLFGFPSVDMFSLDIVTVSKMGTLGCFGILVMCFFIYFFIFIAKKFNKLNSNYMFFFIYFVCCFVICDLLICNTSMDGNGSYFLPLLPLGFIVIELGIELFDYKIEYIEKVIRYVIVVCCFISSFGYAVLFKMIHPRRYEGIDELYEYVQENNIDTIYAPFWYGNVITELTNGETHVFVYDDLKTLDLYKWLQEKNDDKYLKDDIYIFVKENDLIDINYLQDDVLYQDYCGNIMLHFDNYDKYIERNINE